jgi:hypothetical protein
MKNIVSVKAQAFDRETGKAVGDSRVEEINLEENEIFKGCKTILEIKKAYEAFWNELNTRSREIVFVQEITE